MKHLLVRPFRLIKIISVLREARQIDNTEIGTACRPSERSRLAYIVEPCPQILSANKVIVTYQLDSFLVRIPPRHMTIVIRRARIAGISKRLVPSFRPDIHLVTRHPVIPPGSQSRITLRNDERFPGKICRYVRDIHIMIVVSYNIKCLRPEQMVERIRFIASCRNRACRVELFHYIRQFLCQQRIHTHLPVLCQHILRMPEVQYQVRLLQTQSVRISMTPLLQHLISDAPHENGRMVAVTQNEIAQVPLMPFVEITGIVVSCLFFAPHIKCLIHHNESHTVAQVEQLRSRGIVGAAYAIASHLFQNLQLAFDGTNIHRCAQATQVMMHAHSVYLHRLSIEGKAFLRIKAESTDAHRSFITVYTAVSVKQFRHQCIKVRFLYSPKLRTCHFQLLYGYCVRSSADRA